MPGSANEFKCNRCTLSVALPSTCSAVVIASYGPVTLVWDAARWKVLHDCRRSSEAPEASAPRQAAPEF